MQQQNSLVADYSSIYIFVHMCLGYVAGVGFGVRYSYLVLISITACPCQQWENVSTHPYQCNANYKTGWSQSCFTFTFLLNV